MGRSEVTQVHRSSSLPFDRTARPPCAAVLVVVDRDGELASQVSRAAAGMTAPPVIERQPSFLHALGYVGTRPAPAAVVGRPEDLHGSVDAVAAAFARLSPATQLVIVAPRDQASAAGAALERGFDRWWDEPINTASLLSLQGGLSPFRAEDDASTQAPADKARIDAAEAVMIETLLRRRHDLVATGVAQLRSRSDLSDIDFIADVPADSTAAPVPAARVASPVEYRDKRFGLLHAPPHVARAALASAAVWLGRWLALGDQMNQLWDMALRDPLTGAWNRRYFERFLKIILERAAAERFAVTLLLFDIDDFKRYNDCYGHAAGDEILCETAKLMSQMVRPHDVVARIGGDEFAVIFWESESKRKPDSHHPQDVNKATRRFRAAIAAHKFPKLADEAPGTLTISGGLASFPWDGRSVEQLLERADAMALESKRQGKNVITFGPGALQMCQKNGVDAAPHADAPPA
jgi:two-component system, cell cycle response regulator